MINLLLEQALIREVLQAREDIVDLSSRLDLEENLGENYRDTVNRCIDSIDRLSEKLNQYKFETEKLQKKIFRHECLIRNLVEINLKVFDKINTSKSVNIGDQVDRLGELFENLKI